MPRTTTRIPRGPLATLLMSRVERNLPTEAPMQTYQDHRPILWFRTLLRGFSQRRSWVWSRGSGRPARGNGGLVGGFFVGARYLVFPDVMMAFGIGFYEDIDWHDVHASQDCVGFSFWEGFASDN